MSKYLKSNFLNKCAYGDEQLADDLLAHPNYIQIIGAVLREAREANYRKQGYTWEEDGGDPIGHLVGGDPFDTPRPPGDDHGRLFRRNGKPCFYLSMPYGLGSEDIPAIVKYCKRYGMEASFNSDDIWFPGRTIAIVYFVDHDLCPRYRV